MRGSDFLPVVIVAALLPLSACGAPPGEGKWKNNMACKGNLLAKTCVMTEGEYLGLKIGMSKQQAFESLCRGEAHKYLENAIFRGTNPDDWKATSGEISCDLQNETLSRDYWSFIVKSDSNDGGLFVEFVDTRLVEISYKFNHIAI